MTMNQNGSKPKRTFVVGDLHGALKALKQCITRSGYNNEEDQLIFLGDYADGWSDNASVIEFLYWFGTAAVHKPIFLKGNHDQWVSMWLSRGITNETWLLNGGKNTVRDYIRTSLLTKHTHRQFFDNLLEFYVDKQNRGFVHAGYCSIKGLGHEFCETEYAWDRTLWRDAIVMNNRVGSDKHRCYQHEEIFIGHTPTLNYEFTEGADETDDLRWVGKPIDVPMKRLNIWNVDTGAGWSGGKLTIMDVDTKEFWQSDVVDTLYPKENPR